MNKHDKILNEILIECMERYFRRYSVHRYMCGWHKDMEYVLYEHVFVNTHPEDFVNTKIIKSLLNKIKFISDMTESWFIYDTEIENISIIDFKKKYNMWVAAKTKKKSKRKYIKKSVFADMLETTQEPAQESISISKPIKSNSTNSNIIRTCIKCGATLIGKQRKYCSVCSPNNSKKKQLNCKNVLT